MNVACLPRTVHTRIEFPKEHVFNFHARIILNGGKTVERDNKTGKKKETLATKTILLLFCCTASSSKCGQWTSRNGIDHVAPSPSTPTSSPLGSNTQVNSSSSCRCIAFFSCRCLFSKGYSKLVKRLASSNKKNETTKYIKIVQE